MQVTAMLLASFFASLNAFYIFVGLIFKIKDLSKQMVFKTKKMEKYSDELIAYKKIARFAGLWYLILAITSGYSWMFITNIVVAGNPSLTASNILLSDIQYIISIICNIIGQISFVFLGMALYNLLRSINRTQAKLMFSFVLISVPIMFINIFLQTGAFLVLKRFNFLNVFTNDQVNSISMLFVNLNIAGVHIVEIFWGLWLFPLAYLIYKSNFFPKILAILLVISGLCYIVGSLSSLINPGFYAGIEKLLSIPEAFGELSMLMWLLVIGIKPKN
ncbi:MAG TPA: DUF4386 domain-containing protein [Paludibacter sp.]|nr:DUF4386 domain-containing protein [Paludibacter sp.]